MSYQNKLNKYLLKLKHTGGKSSIITDNPILDKCEQPKNIRVLQHPITKKIVILLGESHKRYELTFSTKNYLYRANRIDPNKGIDLVIGQITKKINNAQTNPENPLHKVLLLAEIEPSNILLGGSNINTDLFEDKVDTTRLEYISNKFEFIQTKYKNILYRNIDIRKVLNIEDAMAAGLKQHVKILKNLQVQNLYDEINGYFNDGYSNIKKYIISDEEFTNLPWKFPPPFPDEENQKFFGKNYTRKPLIFPRKLSEVFIHTKDIYKRLVKLFNYFDRTYDNSILNHSNEDERLNLFFNKISMLDPLIGRIMDLYILEYISLMENDTSTVVYTGSKHTEFLYYELILIEGYKVLEIENISYKYLDGNNTKCEREFPYEKININELNIKCDNIKKMYDNISKKYKNIFIMNMIMMDKSWENNFNDNPHELFL